MSKNQTLTITKTTARRFLISYHHLWHPRQFKGKAGIMDFIRQVGSIQYDPLNIVGRNPDLVLQARVGDYSPILLDELLYRDRLLIDGWDKMASIYPVKDWPYFARYRHATVDLQRDSTNPTTLVSPEILNAIRESGPLFSNDLTHNSTVIGPWGRKARLVSVAMDMLFAKGDIGIHHRAGTRRCFDLSERLLSPDIRSAPDPNPDWESYQDWHILRRIGSTGLADASSGQYWQGIISEKGGSSLHNAIKRLLEQNALTAIEVEGITKRLGNRHFYIRSADLPLLENAQRLDMDKPQASIIAALDNLTWQRGLLRQIFEFNYTWEVYKPVDLRQYGYYVLPILYGDRFVARFEPLYDKKNRLLTIKNWWWESGIVINLELKTAIAECLQDFLHYLNAESIQPGPLITDSSIIDLCKMAA